MKNGEKCTKNYKYNGSTGNLGSHIIKYSLILSSSAETIISAEIKSKPVQTTQNKNRQKEKEESTLQ